MEFGDTFVVGGVVGGFHKMFLKSQAVEGRVVVELQQSLGQLAVGQTLVEKQNFDDIHFATLLQ